MSTMDLVLWRHAEAIDLELVGDDMLRTLSPRGEKQALRMAIWLDRQLPAGTKVYCSPALRAEQTAQALNRKYKVNPALAPLASVQDLLHLVHWPQASSCVLAVGHQPTIGQTIAQLLDMPGQTCVVKKGAVWWLRYRERDGGAQTSLLSVQAPDLL